MSRAPPGGSRARLPRADRLGTRAPDGAAGRCAQCTARSDMDLAGLGQSLAVTGARAAAGRGGWGATRDTGQTGFPTFPSRITHKESHFGPKGEILHRLCSH